MEQGKKEADATMDPSVSILQRLQRHGGLRRDQLLGNVSHYLASAILEHYAFETIESLVAFCEDPDNMRSWLPSEVDRIVFSDELVTRLRQIRSVVSTTSQTSVETGWPRPTAPSNM